MKPYRPLGYVGRHAHDFGWFASNIIQWLLFFPKYPVGFGRPVSWITAVDHSRGSVSYVTDADEMPIVVDLKIVKS